MPRAHKGPRLELYGPDDRFGARPKRGFGQYAYYIRWTENGKTRERTTGIAATGGPPDIAAAEDALRRFLEYQRDTAQSGSTLGPRRADQIALAEVLDIYGREHATTVAAPARIAYAIDALVPYWGGMTVSEVTATARRAYVEHRRRAFAAREDARIAGVTAVGKQPKPARILSTDTVRRELGGLMQPDAIASRKACLSAIPRRSGCRRGARHGSGI